MEIQTQEARIILAIEAIQSSRKLSKHSAAKMYEILYTTFSYRMAGWTHHLETRSNCLKLDKIEEGVITRFILDLDSRGFTL